MEPTKQIFTLLQVTKSIQKTIAERYTSSYWVKAELNKLNHYKHSGHCYPELVDKHDGKIVAQVSGTLWKDDFLRANNNFLTTLKEPLKDGIKVLMLVRVSFDPSHGLSLRILEIDPSFTLGDLQKEKQETIDKLKAAGIYDRNRLLVSPVLPQRIAIISVESSKGFADFLSVISNNQWNYKFFHMLFPSVLQGEKAVDGIIAQLKRIKKVRHHFDVVAIIRGGGGDVGLSCYNSYKLAEEIAGFPIPIITGIGHATNETVVEMISHLNAITPTKLADYLMQRFHDFAFPVLKSEEKIIEKSRKSIADNQRILQSELKWFKSVAEKMLTHNDVAIRSFSVALSRQSDFRFQAERKNLTNVRIQIQRTKQAVIDKAHYNLTKSHVTIEKDAKSMLEKQQLQLQNHEHNIANMSPMNVLKRGYSITLHNGKAVHNVATISIGDSIETILFNGQMTSIIQSKEKNHE
ncbi:MAG TPA: exodeoxyribonuclease VII large subunit [Flavobacterium sp.]|jgi:exodeoxyribonuclease VII large subunit